MVDITEAMQAKSDQLNALDIVGSPLIIRVRATDYKKGRDQPLWVYYDGDNNRPWKPSKGMIRVLCGAWGTETDAWIGRHARLEFEPSVMYAGKEVGGVWIKALSDIPQKGMMFSLAINRSKRIPFPVDHLVVESNPYPQDRFDKAFPAMVEKMRSGEMTLPQVIAQCQKTGTLTEQQLAKLEESAPIDVSEDDHYEPSGDGQSETPEEQVDTENF